MTHMKLIKSEGSFAMIRSAETTVSIPKEELIAALKKATIQKNNLVRDDESNVVYIEGEKFVIDTSLLKGNIKKIIDDLQENLQPIKYNSGK